jgi:hypothetical protein
MQVHKARRVPGVSQNTPAILCCRCMVLTLRCLSCLPWKNKTVDDGAVRQHGNHSSVIIWRFCRRCLIVPSSCLGNSSIGRCCWGTQVLVRSGNDSATESVKAGSEHFCLARVDKNNPSQIGLPASFFAFSTFHQPSSIIFTSELTTLQFRNSR